MAKYIKIAEEIRERIVTGVYPVDKALPDQINLAKEFQTSRVTVKKSLELLAVEGLVYSKQGSGTYVRKNALQMSKLDNQLDEYVGVAHQLADRSSIASQILKFDVRFPNELECEKLLIDKTQPVYDIVRLRFVDDEPFLIEHTVMPVHVIPGISEEILTKSIYEYIKGELGLKFGGANRHIRADKPNELDRMYLECEIADPVLEIDQVVYLTNGVPFEYSQSRHRYDKGDVLVVNIKSV
ncbi:GntR family transcriptional regulator [Carnobacterium gallinarum]|uniref:GntR family transcriptional regulator n=1 Tax=Carnobacterium gallinarum TaxID=2749 RepID=UPI00054F2719|nr:GntR family transcriptional regulator [Carnobacterium gallinarum]